MSLFAKKITFKVIKFDKMSIFIKTLEKQSQTTFFALEIAPPATFCPSSPWIAPPFPSRAVTKPGYGPEDLTNTLTSTKKRRMNKHVSIQG